MGEMPPFPRQTMEMVETPETLHLEIPSVSNESKVTKQERCASGFSLNSTESLLKGCVLACGVCLSLCWCVSVCVCVWLWCVCVCVCVVVCVCVCGVCGVCACVCVCVCGVCACACVRVRVCVCVWVVLVLAVCWRVVVC